jgi:hypothetical protein
MSTLKMASKTALLSSAALTTTFASASDQDLLDTLLENGVLNKAQYEKLVKKADKQDQMASAPMSKEMLKAMDWDSRVKVSGDMRFRHENIDKDDANGVKESRQRIRARLNLSS